MTPITAAQLRTVLLLTCVTAQVVSQVTLSANSTMSPRNQTGTNNTVTTSPFGNTVNMTTAPAGSAHLLCPSAFFILICGVMATTLLHHCC